MDMHALEVSTLSVVVNLPLVPYWNLCQESVRNVVICSLVGDLTEVVPL